MRSGLLTLALLLAACAPVYERPAVTGSIAGGSEQVAFGERVFFRNCHGCHPHGGRGIGRGVTDRPLPDFAVRLQIREGIGEMPGFDRDEIGDRELDALIAYLNALRRYWAQSSR